MFPVSLVAPRPPAIGHASCLIIKVSMSRSDTIAQLDEESGERSAPLNAEAQAEH
jgi:hypothetical protein